MTYQYADIGIKPMGSLAETALVLGKALGGIAFVQDTEGRFDEYPAIAESGRLRFALLGVPGPADIETSQAQTSGCWCNRRC